MSHETTVNCLDRKHKDSKEGTFRPRGGGVVCTQRPPPSYVPDNQSDSLFFYVIGTILKIISKIGPFNVVCEHQLFELRGSD